MNQYDSVFMTAEEAAAALGITRATLYAYVSRGLIRSEAVEGSRRRRYARDDVERLIERREMRRDPALAAERSLDWGGPVIESAITRIEDEGLFYRGRDVRELARRRSVEEVAALLWTGEPSRAAELFGEPSGARTSQRRGRSAPKLELPQAWREAPPLERCQAGLALAGAEDPAAWDLRPSSVAATGARILSSVSRWCGGESGPAAAVAGVAETLATAWGLGGEARAIEAVGTALILCADHELNVSTFTARCVASAGSHPYDVVAAGLAALKGTRHGGATGRVEALLREAESVAAEAAVAGRLRRGDSVPGFGHRLYPGGDPRGRMLLDLTQEVATDPDDLSVVDAVGRSVEGLLGEPPNLDFGLVALARALRLPDGTGLVLFAVGRTIGWIGHAIEEYERDRLIRPRARYVGR